MEGFLHQCKLCGHTWMCDNRRCRESLYATDGRCIYGWSPGIYKLSGLPESAILTSRGTIRKGYRMGRAV